MKDGYYWARDKEDGEWVVVEVYEDEVFHCGVEVGFPLSDYEFGDKIEIPEKYQ